MTKEELIRLLESENITNADQTVKNIETKVVDDVKPAEGMPHEELPTQAGVEKMVNAAEEPIVPADKDGVSKNGGESDDLEAGKIEAERKKEDNGMKDVINVSSRKVEENSEVNNELLSQLKEAQEREEGYKSQIENIQKLCEESIAKATKEMTAAHAIEMKKVFEAVIAEGESFQAKLAEGSKKTEKLYATAQKMYENATRLNKILLEAVKKAQPEKKMVRYQTAAARALASLKK